MTPTEHHIDQTAMRAAILRMMVEHTKQSILELREENQRADLGNTDLLFKLIDRHRIEQKSRLKFIEIIARSEHQLDMAEDCARKYEQIVLLDAQSDVLAALKGASHAVV